MDCETTHLIKLESADGKVFTVDINTAKASMTIRNILEDIDEADDAPIPLPNVSGTILDKVIKYCDHHKDDAPVGDDPLVTEGDVSAFDAAFVKVDQSTLYQMIMAANFLDIKPMLNLTCKTVANMIIGKTPGEIRELFNIKNDFTAAEEEQMLKENAWAEDKS